MLTSACAWQAAGLYAPEGTARDLEYGRPSATDIIGEFTTWEEVQENTE